MQHATTHATGSNYDQCNEQSNVMALCTVTVTLISMWRHAALVLGVIVNCTLWDLVHTAHKQDCKTLTCFSKQAIDRETCKRLLMWNLTRAHDSTPNHTHCIDGRLTCSDVNVAKQPDVQPRCNHIHSSI